MKHHICKFEVSTKKGDVRPVTFLVEQERPFPRIHGDTTRLVWQNFDGLFSAYQRPACGLGRRYYCYQLRSDIDASALPADYNRTHFAGVEEYQTRVIAPGAITLRGKSLGELMIHFGDNPDYPSIKVRGSETASGSERQFVEMAILPRLKEFIQQNRATLRQQAIDAVTERMKSEVARARAEISKLEIEIQNVTF